MISALFYAVLFVFWLEATFRFKPIDIKGLSTINLLYLVLGAVFVLGLILQRRKPRISSLHKYCVFLIFIVLCAIPQKFILGEIEKIGLVSEALIYKNWVEPFIVFFIFYDLIDNRKTCHAAIWGLLLFLMATVVVTLLMVFNIAYIGDIQWERGGAWPDFAEPNQYGAFLVLMIPILLSFLIVQKDFRLKLLAGVSSVLVSTAVICTGSRGCFLSCLIALSAYTAFLYRWKIVSVDIILVAVFLVSIAVFSGFYITPDRIKEETTSRVEYGESQDLDDYSSGRLTIWSNAFELFLLRPFIGHGMSAFKELNRKYYGLKFSAHNEYLACLVNHGAFGLLAFLAIHVSIFFYVSHNLQNMGNEFGRMLLLSYICGFIGWSVSRFTVEVFNLQLIFWMYTAVVYAYCRIEREEKSSANAKAPKVSFSTALRE